MRNFHLQVLTKGSAQLCLKVGRFMREQLRIPAGSRIILAMSGGADSTALATILVILANSGFPIKLFALTLDHGLRPESADDARFVSDFCAGMHIPCTCQRANVSQLAKQWHMGLEEAGRKVRYNLLEAEREKRKADFIATAHHKNDLSEDIILRLIRGTGWPALGGMMARDDARHLIRPLLEIEKEKLTGLLTECAIKWRTDASNNSNRFRRNRIRETILPALKYENPSIDDNMFALWRLAQNDKVYWQEIIDDALKKYPWIKNVSSCHASISLPRELLACLPSSARLRLYLKVTRFLASMLKENKNIQGRSKTFFDLEHAYINNMGNKIFQLPGNVEIRLKKGRMIFIANKI